MLFSSEIEALHDDGFDGSIDECKIFKEVFFGKDDDKNSNKCMVTGVIDFHCDYRKQTEVSLFSNSENSVLTSQQDSCNVNEEFGRKSRPGCFAGFTALLSNEDDANVKRVKKPVNELTNARSCSGEVVNSSAHINSISQPAALPVCRIVTCRLVESSNQGVTSSCYLLKRFVETDRGGPTGDRDVSNDVHSTLDGIIGKEVKASKAIASPVSQESSATKLLAASQLVTLEEKSGSPECVKNRWGKSNLLEVDVAKMSLNRDTAKDNWSLVRNHMNHLFIAAGWSIGRRRREHTVHGEYVYISPQGQPIRKLRRAWNMCGQYLFANLDTVVHESEGKQWTDISQFSSDLSDMLTEVEEQLHCSGSEVEEQLDCSGTTFLLAHRWCLLDPFVNIVVIDKLVKALKAGYAVKADRCLLIDTHPTSDTVLALKDVDSTEYQFAEGHEAHELYDSSLVMESSEGNRLVSNKQHGHSSSNCFGRLQGGALEAQKGMLACLSEDNGASSVDTVNDTGYRYVETFRNKRRCVDPATFPAHSSGENYSQGGSSLYEVIITSDNTTTVESENYFGEQDINTSSLVRHKHRHKCDEEMPLRIMGDVLVCSDDEPFDRKFDEVGGQLLPSSNSTSFGPNPDFILRKMATEKAKQISEIKLTSLYQNDKLGLYARLNDVDNNSDHLKSRNSEEYLVSNIGSNKSCKTSALSTAQQWSKKNQLNKTFLLNSGTSKKLVQVTSGCNHPVEAHYDNETDGALPHVQNSAVHCPLWRKVKKSKKLETQYEGGQNRSSTCQIKDDDLLISAVIKNKNFTSFTKLCTQEKSFSRSKALRKRKGQKGGCRLLPRSSGKGGKNIIDGRWTVSRTVISWLIETGVLSLNEVIQYRSPKDGAVVKDGLVARDGILCKCCNKMLSLSEFKIHAGYRQNRPCLNLFLESGKPFTLCQLEAWSAEYKARKNARQTVQIEEMDQNDDSCGLCGDGGELICCDNCPSTFHQGCLYSQELPEGSWYCAKCTCPTCGDLVDEKEALKSSGALKCLQCEYKYHGACKKYDIVNEGVASNPWFCGKSCQEVYSGLQSCIGLLNVLSDGFSWTLLRCIHGDQRVHSAQRSVALKAECNSKLAVSLKIMEECFLSMVDPRTGVDMIPHLLYNWGSTFARLDYHDFYTIVLEKNDVLLSVASIRIHGVALAEMPLIATCSRYRRQGMCRRLMNCIQELLMSLKVEKLVITAIPDLVETWTVGFGFTPLEENERLSLSNFNLMVFPGTIWLKKPLFENHHTTDQRTGANDSLGCTASSQGEPISESAKRKVDTNCGVEFETETQTQIRISESRSSQDNEYEEGTTLGEDFSKLSCEPDVPEKSHLQTQFMDADGEKMQEGEEKCGSVDRFCSKVSFESDSLDKGSLDVNEMNEFSVNGEKIQHVHVSQETEIIS